jgi:large subunit ribosomal protein L54
MLCTTCRSRLLSRLPTFKHHVPSKTLFRSVATAPATSNAAPINPPPVSSDTTPAPSSSNPGTSQPLSTRHASTTAPSPKTQKVRSSVAGGAVLQGLGYTKAKPSVLAKEDEEYPDWLWNILEEKGSSGGGVDVTCISFCASIPPNTYANTFHSTNEKTTHKTRPQTIETDAERPPINTCT